MSELVAYLVAILAAFVAGLVMARALYRSGQGGPAERELESRHSDVLAALDLVVDGDMAGAYEILSELARGRASPPELYFALAALLRSMGWSDRSAQVFRTILARPDLGRDTANKARIGLARDLVALGRADEAKAIIDELPRRLRAESGLLALQKEVALRRGDWNAALSAGQALVKAQDKNGESRADVLAVIAQQAAARGDAEAAHKAFRKALRVKPDSIRARQGLAQLYLQNGKSGKARRQLMAALASNPDLAPIILPQLRALLAGDGGGDEDRFEELLDDLKDHPGVSLWIGLERADRLYRADRLEDCRLLLEQLVRVHPRSVEVHEAYLNLLLELEDDKVLQRELERLIDLAAEEIRRFRCRRCGFLSATPFMECPHCRAVGELAYEA